MSKDKEIFKRWRSLCKWKKLIIGDHGKEGDFPFFY